MTRRDIRHFERRSAVGTFQPHNAFTSLSQGKNASPYEAATTWPSRIVDVREEMVKLARAPRLGDGERKALFAAMKVAASTEI